MDSFTYTRRKARAALQLTFSDAGIPGDFIVLPHQDDYERLEVVSEGEVRWIADFKSTIIATAWFFDEFTGNAEVEDMSLISESREYYPDAYGFRRGHRVNLAFDLTGTPPETLEAWRALPRAPIRRRGSKREIKVISSRCRGI